MTVPHAFDKDWSSGPDFLRREHHLSDLGVLEDMAATLQAQVKGTPLPRDRRVAVEDPTGREHTVLIAQPERLRSLRVLTVVGFFGQRNPTASPQERQALWDIDDRLVEEVSQHSGILSLSYLELADGNYGNLVVLADRAAAEHWTTSPTHSEAVRHHAPKNYQSIRIHNGTLTDGVLAVTRTKYYDFRGPTLWTGVRDFPVK
jgi:hypothetical protein